jgi:NADPH-dependent 7-cyano-7-deazaguanine reductase QueF
MILSEEKMKKSINDDMKENKKRQDHEIKKMIETKLKIMEKNFTKEYMKKYLEYEKNLDEEQRNKVVDICRKINDYLDNIDVEHGGRWYIFASLMIDTSYNYL